MHTHNILKKYRKLPGILNEDEQKALLAQPNPKVPTGLRNACMLRVMLDAGLTISEVTGLRPGEIDFAHACINVCHPGKDGGGRLIWLGAENIDLLAQWIKVRPDAEYLFCTLKGGRLDDRYIREMVKRMARKAKIEKNVFPHSLRHTFAADLYRKSRNIRIVQEALGHVDLSTTMIYANILEEKPEEAIRIFVNGRRKEQPKEQASEIADVEIKAQVPQIVQPEIQQKNRPLRVHALKCKCGDILGTNMNYCPGCGISIETLLEALRQDFYRINFLRSPNK